MQSTKTMHSCINLKTNCQVLILSTKIKQEVVHCAWMTHSLDHFLCSVDRKIRGQNSYFALKL